ncbi:MAG: stage II sporulation protein D [Firmicutes bacterium]|nr:stage II sporulation protein D [Bacillota bacterium]
MRIKDFVQVVSGFVGVLGLFFLLVPAAVVFLWGDVQDGGKAGSGGVSFADRLEVPDMVTVWLTDEEKAVKIDFEHYVCCVTASEMPAGFEKEAIKAQSVAARTYAMSRITKHGKGGPQQHLKAPLCDTTHCQVYKPEKELISIHEEGWEEKCWKKVQQACKATEGQLLYYDGKLAGQTLFFSSSGGQTENSEDVFVSAVPYLISVSSPYEEKATHQNEEKSFTMKEFKKKLQKAFPEEDFGAVGAGSVKVISRTAGGRVDEMQIGDVVLKGTQVRSALGLSSTLFTISFRDSDGGGTGSEAQKQIVFTSSGSGHGVGMSQYGADGMAKEGYNYKEILKHYYSGTEIY